MKIKIKRKYNDLTFEERQIVHFYIYERIILELTQLLFLNRDDITPRLRQKLRDRIETLKKSLEDEYEV